MAASSRSESDRADAPFSLLCCQNCSTTFGNERQDSTPHVLWNCGHTLCGRCVAAGSVTFGEDTKVVTCPFCRTATDYTHDGQPMRNHPLLALISSLQAQPSSSSRTPCAACDEEAIASCDECERVYCSGCWDRAHFSSKLSSHSRVACPDLCPLRCIHHPAAVAELVCSEPTCALNNYPLCRECLATPQHRGHRQQAIDHIAQAQRRSLLEALQQARLRLNFALRASKLAQQVRMEPRRPDSPKLQAKYLSTTAAFLSASYRVVHAINEALITTHSNSSSNSNNSNSSSSSRQLAVRFRLHVDSLAALHETKITPGAVVRTEPLFVGNPLVRAPIEGVLVIAGGTGSAYHDAVYAAVGSRDIRLLRSALLTHGAFIDAPNPRAGSHTPMHRAASLGWSLGIETLALMGSEAVDTPDCEGRTPLYAAVLGGHVEAVEMLVALDSRAIDRPAKEGDTPMHAAVRKGHLDMISALVRLGSRAIDAPNALRVTPMCTAALSSRADAAQRLYELGSRAVDTPSRHGDTPMHIASQQNDVELMRLLVKWGSKAIDATNDFGETPLLQSVTVSNARSIVMLVQLGSQAIDKPDAQGDTPMHAAAARDCAGIIETLVQLGSQAIDMPNLRGGTPLYRAAEAHNVACVEVLKALGASVAPIASMPKFTAKLSEHKVAEIRYRVYFTQSLKHRLLFALDCITPRNPVRRRS